MSLEEPTLLVDFTLATEAIELQAVVQTIVQIAVTTCVDPTDLLQVSAEKRVARA